MNKFLLVTIFILAVAGTVAYTIDRNKQTSKPNRITQSDQTSESEAVQPRQQEQQGQEQQTAPAAAGLDQTKLQPPLTDALNRITKKPFGVYVTPGNSPVSPERFHGYHTGVDFEAFANERNSDVPVSAICTGKLLRKDYERGYGGVAVQACTVDNQAVTVVYGHLRLASIKPAVSQTVNAGEQIAVLGTGYSSETDGERKHLHLGIHKGTSINTSGYVSTKDQLQNWIDVTKYLK